MELSPGLTDSDKNNSKSDKKILSDHEVSPKELFSGNSLRNVSTNPKSSSLQMFKEYVQKESKSKEKIVDRFDKAID